MKGWLGRGRLEPGTALPIVSSPGVHTRGMRVAIDVVALDRNLGVLGIWKRAGRFPIAALGWQPRAMLELPEGEIRQSNISVNDYLAIAH